MVAENTMISYAQNFEDVMLMRALANIERGRYIDVGAAWPDQDSVTRAFYEKGWHGINIEPNPDFLKLLQNKRPRDNNVGMALGRAPGTLPITIFEGSGLSTLVDSIAEEGVVAGRPYIRQQVSVTTLNAIWNSYFPRGEEVHFLKIDVEGFEQAVLEGNDWTKNRPWIVLVEATIPNSQIEVYEGWEKLLLTSEYFFVYTDGLNRFYVAKEHAYLIPAFKFPPNIFDGFKLRAQFEIEQKLLQSEGMVEALKAKASILKSEASEADRAFAKNVEKMEARLVALERRAVNAEHEISRLRQSMSWRITLPLRLLADLALHFFPLIRHGLNRAIHGAINACRRPLSYLISFVLQKPKASARINQWLLQKYPALHAQLLDIHSRPGRIHSFMMAGFSQSKELSREDLTPRGHKIYTDLRGACKSSH